MIIRPRPSTSAGAPQPNTVSFIDYEYATPCPAAFDLANHFAEWGGLSCDYSVLPTRSVRRTFLHEYLDSYKLHTTQTSSPRASARLENGEEESGLQTGEEREQTQEEWRSRELEQRLFDDVDRFRGVPGLYWGVWALIQKTISQIDFDYASYAEVRLGEYWAWREHEHEHEREKEVEDDERNGGEKGQDGCLANGERKVAERERRWASE